MAIKMTIAVLKSEPYLNITDDTRDNVLQSLIDDVVREAIDYLDSDVIIDKDTIPVALERKLYKQCCYEWRRKNDLGLSAQIFPDGSVNKLTLSEWLSDVKDALNRHVGMSL